MFLGEVELIIISMDGSCRMRGLNCVVAQIRLAETAMYRFKQLMAEKISLRNCNGQVGEIMAYVRAMNKLNTLGLPVRKPQQ